MLDARHIVHVRGQETQFKDEYALFCVTGELFRADDDATEATANTAFVLL
jgi:hypothetical protein